MSKKLLAILASLSMAGCVVAACDDDNGNNGGDSCSASQIACEGTASIKVCLNNKWSVQPCPSGQTCAVGSTGTAACGAPVPGGNTCTDGAMACEGNNVKVCTNKTWASTPCPAETNCVMEGTVASCKPSTGVCTNGATQCVNNVSQICSNGTWTNGGNACGGTEPKAGDPCDESTYPGGCSNDGTKRYYCQSGKLVEKSCDSGKSCIVKGNNSSSCESNEPGETCTKETYQAGCTDNLNGSYCGSKGTVVKVSCTADKPCVNNDGFIKCDDGSGGGNSDPCTANSTSACKKNCTNDKSTGYYWTGSKVVVVDCSAKNDCNIDSQNHVVCGDGGSSGGETCTKETYTPGCSDDMHGAYCGSKGTVVNVTCKTGEICNNNNGYISCIEDAGTCTYGSYTAHCDGDIALFCQYSGTIKKQTCGAGQCVSCTDGYTFCNSNGKTCANVESGVDHSVACNGDKKTSGGTDGDCCDIVNYMPACNGKNVTYCSSVGKVKTKSCATTCSVDQSTKNYTCK